jgi:hypothetical protein
MMIFGDFRDLLQRNAIIIALDILSAVGRNESAKRSGDESGTCVACGTPCL